MALKLSVFEGQKFKIKIHSNFVRNIFQAVCSGLILQRLIDLQYMKKWFRLFFFLPISGQLQKQLRPKPKCKLELKINKANSENSVIAA